MRKDEPSFEPLSAYRSACYSLILLSRLAPDSRIFINDRVDDDPLLFTRAVLLEATGDDWRDYFYKTMPSKQRFAGQMQDVYKIRVSGVPLYVKFTMEDSWLVVLSFKEDEPRWKRELKK